MIPWILVGLGGAAGAISRYAVDRTVTNIVGPTVLGTFLINVTGSFLLGLFVAAVLSRTTWHPELRTLIAVGFLGAYTTFSTLTVATVQLADSGEYLRATLNLVGSIAVGLVAAYLGIVVGRAL